MLKISFFTASDTEAWDRYVSAHQHATFFHQTGWKRVIEKTFSHESVYLLAREGKRIVGVLPSFVVRSFLFGRFMVSNGFSAYGGVLAERDDVAKKLVDMAKEITKKKHLDYLELRNLHRSEDNLPVKDLYYTFKRPIFRDPDENLKSIPRKSRRMIRVGRDKFRLRCLNSKGTELLDDFYGVYSKSMRSLGSPVYPKILFKNLVEEFGERCRTFLITSSDGEVLSGVMVFYYRNEVLPYYAGSTPKGKRMAANDFMYWCVMDQGCREGFEVFDFGRSKKDTGSFAFKKHWGFKPLPLRYQYFLNRSKKIPDLSPANPKYRKRIEMWKKLPLFLTRFIGPYLVKYIP